MKEFKSLTVNGVVPVSIKDPVNQVFPLVSPIEEYRWIPNWKCNLIHYPNEKVELGAVFSEISSAPFLIGNTRGLTTWTVVKYDPENFIIHFTLDNKHSSSLYKVELQDDGNGGTKGSLDLTYTASDEKGNNLVRNNLGGKIVIMLSILNGMMKFYSEENVILSASEVRSLIPSDQKLSPKDKALILLNRRVRSKMTDENRDRFVEELTVVKEGVTGRNT